MCCQKQQFLGIFQLQLKKRLCLEQKIEDFADFGGFGGDWGQAPGYLLPF
jgi:hypothetical protein